MIYFIELLRTILLERGFHYNDVGGLQVHGWWFEDLGAVPSFSYNNISVELYMKFKNYEDFAKHWDPTMQKSINEHFNIESYNFDRTEYVLKLLLTRNQDKEIL